MAPALTAVSDKVKRERGTMAGTSTCHLHHLCWFVIELVSYMYGLLPAGGQWPVTSDQWLRPTVNGASCVRYPALTWRARLTGARAVHGRHPVPPPAQVPWAQQRAESGFVTLHLVVQRKDRNHLTRDGRSRSPSARVFPVLFFPSVVAIITHKATVATASVLLGRTSESGPAVVAAFGI
jgi:hypothetical protein